MRLISSAAKLVTRTKATLSAAALASTLVSAQAQPSWTIVPTPNPSTVRNLLRGISGTDSSDIWAVGHYQPNAANLVYQNLMLHWNGTIWQTMSVPNPSASNNDLFAIKAISPNLAWAVGNAASGSVANAEILKWDGTSWTQQSVPAITGGSYLFGLTAISSSDMWAVGGKAGSPFPCYALHYNGSSWSEVSVPTAPGSGRNRFNAVHGIASNDVWAVGSWGVAVGDYHFLAMHWDGASWTYSAIPASVNGGIDGELADVKMVSANDVWAVGYSLAGGVVVIHYDGTGWTQVTAPGGGGALAVLSANNIYAVGGEFTHWNGTTWSVDDTLLSYPWPALGATTVLPNGEIWAAGRTVDSANVFQTLVYKRGSTTTAPTGIPMLNADGFTVHVSPNPFSQELNLTITASRPEAAGLMLYDVTGRTVISQRLQIAEGTKTLSLSLPATLSPGAYFMELRSSRQQWKTTLLKR